MNHPSLTDKQQSLFSAIVDHLKTHERWPTVQELMDECGFSSPNSITQLYEALIEKHFIVKSGWGQYDIHPVQRYNLYEGEAEESYGIPIVGYITAGGMQEAVEEDLGRVTLESLLPNHDQMKAWVVNGQSMKEDGIRNGDIVLYIPTEIFDGDIGAV